MIRFTTRSEPIARTSLRLAAVSGVEVRIRGVGHAIYRHSRTSAGGYLDVVLLQRKRTLVRLDFVGRRRVLGQLFERRLIRRVAGRLAANS